jgi:hypothetical protein
MALRATDFPFRMVGWVSVAMAVLSARTATAQTPAAVEPSIRVGATMYADYTYVQEPETTDADGNAIHANAFNVTRSYINLNGTLSRRIAFRITPDITRESGAGSSLNGSLVFRIKYAFAQVNLDDWMPRGSWARFGIQQTPWVDFEEGIYRYRFQGTVFAEREGFMSSSDAGASFHYNSPSNYAELHAGVYNGENYVKPEANNQKAFQVRGSVRPFAQGAEALRGLRGHLFYDADAYVRHAERRRFIASATYEHPRLNAGVDYLRTTDQTSAFLAETNAHGFSIWATPRAPSGWEALLRYDHLTPDTDVDQTRSRTILGVAYWFPMQGGVSSAFLLDYDGRSVDFANGTPEPANDRRIAVHGLINF